MANTLQICRVCLSVNVKMYTLKNTNMENLYKLLTQAYVDLEDGKPATVCFLCYARLRQCERLQQQAIISNELLEQLLKGGFTEATANAILNNQYTSQDLQVSFIYHLDCEPATCGDVFSDPNVEAISPITVKEEKEKELDEVHNLTENLCVKQREKEVNKDPHPPCLTQIQQNDKTSNQEKNKFQNSNNNYVNAEVDLKCKIKLEKMNTNVVPNKQKNHKSIHNIDTQQENISNPITHTLYTISNKFQCNECGKQFSSKDILTDHIFNCMKSSEILVSDSQLTKAKIIKSILSEMYTCDICSFKAHKKRSIEYHLKMHNVAKVFFCYICDYRCASKSKLKQHIRIHTDDKPFSCTICEYRCARKTHLKLHMQRHSSEKPFSCNICDYRCVEKGYLRHHMRIHTGERPFSCNICKFRCIYKYSLKNHMKSHTGEKPFSCTICEYRCARQTYLKLHMKRHSSEKPFSCNICDYRCIQKSNLRNHMRTHTGERPFSCNICEYRCIYKYNLKDHMTLHTGEKPFSCTICEFRCARKSNLKQHVQRQHQQQETSISNIGHISVPRCII